MSEQAHAEHRPPVGQDPSRLGSPPPGTTSWGQLYPLGDVLAVIDDRFEAERAVQAFREAGVPEGDIDLIDGAWFAEAVRSLKHHQSPLERVVALLGMEEEIARRYVAEADQGHTIVVVHAEQPEVYQRVARLLARHGAHNIRHYGDLVITGQ